MSRISPILRNVNKVLPTVYDDSLSYYEVIAKLTYKMDEIIEAINDNYKNLMERFIQEYFDDLMIDAMYDAETDTLILSKEISIAGETHTYINDERTIEVS